MSITAMKTALSALCAYEASILKFGLKFDTGYAAITALRTAISEAEKPFCWLYYERGEEMFAPPDGYRPDDAQPLFLEAGAQPAPVPESACRVCIYLHKGECGHSHGPLNPRGDYCGGQVLTSKAKMEPVQAQERKPLFKEFIIRAEKHGYDCARMMNSDTGEWICLNPMTADLWRAWQAAHGIKEQP